MSTKLRNSSQISVASQYLNLINFETCSIFRDVGCIIGYDGEIDGYLDSENDPIQTDIPNKVDKKILKLIAEVECALSLCPVS